MEKCLHLPITTLSASYTFTLTHHSPLYTHSPLSPTHLSCEEVLRLLQSSRRHTALLSPVLPLLLHHLQQQYNTDIMADDVHVYTLHALFGRGLGGGGGWRQNVPLHSFLRITCIYNVHVHVAATRMNSGINPPIDVEIKYTRLSLE